MARERKFSTEDLFQTTKQILLGHGYDGFTFSLLAEKMDISRGALYKYYDNKDELITDYMIHEMNQFLLDLKSIEAQRGFLAQFDFLLDTIFKHHRIHQILGIVHQIPGDDNEKIKENKEQLRKQHLDMYKYLHSFINLGRAEYILKAQMPDELILGFIFQSIAIPNHSGIDRSEWATAIKEILSHGMFTN